MEISINTLTMCVLAVDAKIKNLQEQIAVGEDPEISYLEEELLSYSRAEMELKRLYIERQKASKNLLPYEDLLE